MLGNRQSYFGTMDRETITALITAQNAGRQKTYETGLVEYVDALGLEAGKDAPEGALRDGYDYYMPRGPVPRPTQTTTTWHRPSCWKHRCSPMR